MTSLEDLPTDLHRLILDNDALKKRVTELEEKLTEAVLFPKKAKNAQRVEQARRREYFTYLAGRYFVDDN